MLCTRPKGLKSLDYAMNMNTYCTVEQKYCVIVSLTGKHFYRFQLDEHMCFVQHREYSITIKKMWATCMETNEKLIKTVLTTDCGPANT